MAGKGGISDETLRLFANDLEAYAKVCLRIRTKEAEIKPLIFNNAQRIVNTKIRDQYKETGRVRAIVLKARQEGVSTYTAARFFRRTTMFPHQEALILADKLERSKKLFGIYDRFYYNLPPEMQPMTRYVSKQTQMVFDNPDDKERYAKPGLGSSITVETASDADVGRASTTNLIHASEMAFWPNGEDVWVALAQAVPRLNSEIVIESTANGVGNFFHNFWTSAEEENDPRGFIPIFLPWWIHEEYQVKVRPREREEILDTLDDSEQEWYTEGFEWEGGRHLLTVEQIAWRRQHIRDTMRGNERAFQQEFPATAEEAFLVSGNGFFDEDKLKEYDRSSKPPKYRANLKRSGGGVLMPRAERGYVRVWLRPDEKRGNTDKQPIYIISADTASGRQVAAEHSLFTDPEDERGGRDFSCADVLDIANRRQVAQIHGRMAPEIFAEFLYCAGYLYSTADRSGTRSPALIVVENNHSSGETVLNLLQKGHPHDKFGRYPRLYYQRLINRRTMAPQKRLGWSTNVETRMPMLDNLADEVRNGTFEIPNKDTIKEMRTFVRGEDGKPQGQEGTHDDRVISLAIGLFVGNSVNLEPPKHSDETELIGVASSATGLFDY